MANRKKLLFTGGAIFCLYVGSLLIGRIVHGWELRRVTQSGAIEDVAVLTPKPADPMVSITLPGTIDAWYSARIYPQVSGYVKMWFKDYGADVQAGDLMAEINAPSLDAQFAQAKADLSAAEAKYNLSVVTAKRWQAMGKSQSVSGQAVSVSVANMKSQQATLEAAQHNVDRFAALEKFKSIVAPFSGVVTARNISVGDYVRDGSGDMDAKGDAKEMFTVAQVDKLRLFVSVPEVFAYILQPGLEADVTVPQFPNRTFKARFLTMARGFDSNTRTAVTEFVMENADHELWPGTFASIKLTAKNSHSTVRQIPSGALVFQEKGMQVATVDKDNRVHFKDIKVGRMADTSTEVLSGLAADDRVINNPPADLLEGDKVNVVIPAKGYDHAADADGAEAK
ncbi:efflux RND transporter periplasmic adaptor subunit [Candidatus Kirkpatrickella diaphorinae]|uniref:Efflux RND transporter periplasmic adaptor subunit n=1 Tax=Candidatus Kirkpatrickella diaphorinae TaxID=2984322 RepID=A0ABY6GJB9_9PROT|nr:efflux RND transporter periplasmic adaptor subunit [Candidatus Kirkpatrickella diaphorinae]UYH51126.1 efflux RND transporter periplasmic adaptor subunit [Candidatus Kirkpatrickella diaphorinae]